MFISCLTTGNTWTPFRNCQPSKVEVANRPCFGHAHPHGTCKNHWIIGPCRFQSFRCIIQFFLFPSRIRSLSLPKKFGEIRKFSYPSTINILNINQYPSISIIIVPKINNIHQYPVLFVWLTAWPWLHRPNISNRFQELTEDKLKLV